MTARQTETVIRALSREVRMYTPAHEGMTVESLDLFREQASRWLGDKTRLATRTIRGADWEAVYAYVKGKREE